MASLPSGWEHANGTNPHGNDATEDLDGEGHDNTGEFAAGTAANDATSRFELRLLPVPGGGWQAEVFTRAGRRYQLQSGASVVGPWESAGTAFEGMDAVVAVPLPAASGT